MMFSSELEIAQMSWQALERNVSRLLICKGFKGVRVVGQTGDRGADVLATNYNKRYVVQVKHWNKPVGTRVIQETLNAAREYHADVPVVVSSRGFDSSAKERQAMLLYDGIPLQLWSSSDLVRMAKGLPDKPFDSRVPRPYQESAIDEIVSAYYQEGCNEALIVMATGLGKTYVAAESIRRIRNLHPQLKVLVCAHTNDIVYQLERAFWPLLKPSETTLIWNGTERHTIDQLEAVDYVFACVDSVANYIDRAGSFPEFDILLVDECHHAGSPTYLKLFDSLSAGQQGGPFLLGMTATPWRQDKVEIGRYFGEPRINVDTVTGLKKGFLANVDYRMYTDNINWDSLKNLNGKSFSPRQINRTLFIDEWDDAVVKTLQSAWTEQTNPRAIVFCSRVEHAIRMCNSINSLGFCNAKAIYSGTGKTSKGGMSPFERNRILSDFDQGIVNVICAVDIFNEGIDVPDVNILVFQRVTHSRRIFIQQLGRGLRISEGKDKVIVLDFVSDIRRFAAGIQLKDDLASTDESTRISLPGKVTFRRVTGEDPQAESFLRQWLDDVVAIQDAGEDASVLSFPPAFPESKF